MRECNLKSLPVDGVAYYVENAPRSTPDGDLEILAEVYTASAAEIGAACWDTGHVKHYNFYFRDRRYVRGTIKLGQTGDVKLSYRDFLRMIGNQNSNEVYEIF